MNRNENRNDSGPAPGDSESPSHFLSCVMRLVGLEMPILESTRSAPYTNAAPSRKPRLTGKNAH